jgi:hypothetical protein
MTITYLSFSLVSFRATFFHSDFGYLKVQVEEESIKKIEVPQVQ